MISPDLINAFNDCIDRLQAGQSMADCLRAYPHHAAALRPMLETAQAVRQANLTASDAASDAARERVRARVMAASSVASFPQRRARRPLNRPLLPLAAALAVMVLVGAFLAWMGRDNDKGLVVEPLASATFTTAPTESPVESPSVTPAPTGTPTHTPTVTPQPSLTPTEPPCIFRVTFASINLRTGPGTGYDAAGFGYQGDIFPIIAAHSSGAWLQVQYQPQAETGTESTAVWVSTTVGEQSGACDDLPVLSTPPLREESLAPPTNTPSIPTPLPNNQPPAPPPAGDDSPGDGGGSDDGNEDDHSDDSGDEEEDEEDEPDEPDEEEHDD